MSQKEPTKCYVYQPGAITKGGHNPKIYGVAGPGAELFEDVRFTKPQAETLARLINAERLSVTITPARSAPPVCCGHCTYDEAEGGLLKHCAECERKNRQSKAGITT